MDVSVHVMNGMLTLSQLRTLIGCALIFALPLRGFGDAAGDFQTQATAKYPDLARAGSPLHAKFMGLYEEAKNSDPKLLQDPKWPLILAERANAIINPPPPALNTETGEFRDLRGNLYRVDKIDYFMRDAILYETTPPGRLPQKTKVPFTWFAPEVLKWLKDQEKQGDDKRAAERYVDQSKEHYYVEVGLIRENGIMAHIQKAYETTTGYENRGLDRVEKKGFKVYPGASTEFVFISCKPSDNLVSSESGFLTLYPIGTYTSGEMRYRRFTAHRAQALRELFPKLFPPATAEKQDKSAPTE